MLSLSINSAKVAELLKCSSRPYEIFTSDVPMVTENCTPQYPMTSEASGAVYVAPLLVPAETKERLMAARREIEKSGGPLQRTD